MKGLYWAFLAFFLIQCSDEEVAIFESQQVQRLITGGDEKTWILQFRSSEGVESALNCSDSIRLLMSSTSDSVSVTELLPRCTGLSDSFDSLDVGNAFVSSEDGLFTDSLLFEDGTFWIISAISSERMSLKIDENELRFSN